MIANDMGSNRGFSSGKLIKRTHITKKILCKYVLTFYFIIFLKHILYV